MAISELSEEQQAYIADRARIWEVRRFCQVLPSVAEYERVSNSGLTSRPLQPHKRHSGNEPDGALAAFLRCIVHNTQADLAMISLLDDHTQYFVSGASRAHLGDAKVTLADSTRWYGCESVSHHGGLCERTITQRNYPGNLALYEELDMAKVERTKDLPFVQGDIAKFRFYAGIPLNPYDGPNIGTVFIFSETPSKVGLSAADRSYMFEIAVHITKHLEQAVEALEGKRVLRFNQGVASLLKIGLSGSMDADFENALPRPHAQSDQQPLVSNLYTESTLRLYRLAATLLYDTFEFDGVRIQEADMYGKFITHNPKWNGSKVLAQHLGPTIEPPGNPSPALINKLSEMFPQGCVIQILGDSGDVVAATNAEDVAPVVDQVVCSELPKTFPKAQQIILMPLWDTYHERNIGAVLGFSNDQSRVYLSSTDLSSISAFCTTIMTQVRRREAQVMDKIKSDFLGSVSHEMRTPLHGVLSSLELLADTFHDVHQRDLLETAQYSGLSLLETIDRILHFSNISSAARVSGEAHLNGANGPTSHQSGLIYPQMATTSQKKDMSTMLHVCEEIVQREAQRLRLKEAVRPQPSGYGQDGLSRQPSPALSARSAHSIGPSYHPIVLFDTNVAWSCRLTAVASFRAVFANLLDNALKFGDGGNCVRIALDVDETSCILRVTDSGKGIGSAFLRHSAFDAFSQEDPLVEGTGLGLSIVKRTTTTLGGELNVDSNETRGSIFTATYPSARLVLDASQTTKIGATNLPQLELSLFTPNRWRKHDIVRGQFCTEMLLASITRGLSRWFRVTVTPWQSTSTNRRLLFVLQEDVIDAQQTLSDEIHDAKRIVLFPELHATVDLHEAPSDQVATIVGPVTHSSLQDSVACLFPDLMPVPDPPDRHEESDASEKVSEHADSERGRGRQGANGAALDGQLSEAVSRLELGKKGTEASSEDATPWEATPNPDVEHSLNEAMPEATAEAPTDTTTYSAEHEAIQRAPKLLLVDDNPVNLKVLSMYARRCSKVPATSVDGGQKAISTMRKTFSADQDTQPSPPRPFDLIFLDLSMPEISGFEVARQIRELEAAASLPPAHSQSQSQSQSQSRTYICALTGLVSDKDRNAAFASGVDYYLVKPARLKDLQTVIDIWRSQLTSS